MQDQSATSDRNRRRSRESFSASFVKSNNFKASSKKSRQDCRQDIIEDRIYWNDQRQRCCFWLFATSLLGLGFGIIENEVLWHGVIGSWDKDVTQRWATAFKVAILCSTLVSFLFIYGYYSAQLNLRRIAGVCLPPGMDLTSLKGSGLWDGLVFNVAILLPQPLLGLDTTVTMWDFGLGHSTVYNLDSFLVCAMFIRLVFCLRFYAECLSPYKTEVAAALGRFNHVVFDQQFVVKSVFTTRLDLVVLVAGTLVLVLSYMLMVAERPADGGPFESYANCVWLIFITMTTVGYGDEYPSTLCGRAVAILASLTAVIILAVTVNLMVQCLSLSRAESKVLQVLETIRLRKRLKKKAAILIQRWVRQCTFRTLEFRHGRGTSGGGDASLGGYFTIPDLSDVGLPTSIRPVSFRRAVLSSLEVLEAAVDFRDVANSFFTSQLQSDVPELAGELASSLSAQESRIASIESKAKDILKLVDLLSAGGADANVTAAPARAPSNQ